MKIFLKNNVKWIYFILTYLISWPVWIAGKRLLPENLTIITLILGAFGLFTASLILIRVTGERPGWRAYITPALMKMFHPVLACTIVVTGWAVWHLPMYFLEGWGGGDQPFIWLLIYCIPLSMILTWLYYKSRKSIIPVMLLHAGTNVVFRYFPMETKVIDSAADEFTVIKAIVYCLFAILLLIISHGALGYKKHVPINE